MEDHESAKEEEKGSQEPQKDFSELQDIEKCQVVGRIGPSKTSLDQESVFGRITEKDLLIEGTSREFNSIRGDTGFFKGCWYYEVTLKTDGLM